MQLSVQVRLDESDVAPKDLNKLAADCLAAAGGDTNDGDSCEVSVLQTPQVGVVAPPPPDVVLPEEEQ
jgi:hypothetical protein